MGKITKWLYNHRVDILFGIVIGSLIITAILAIILGDSSDLKYIPIFIPIQM